MSIAIACSLLLLTIVLSLTSTYLSGLGWQGFPAVHVALFLCELGLLSAISAAAGKAVFLLRGYLLFFLFAVLLCTGLSVRDVVQEGSYEDLPTLLLCFGSFLGILGVCYGGLRRKIDKSDLSL